MRLCSAVSASTRLIQEMTRSRIYSWFIGQYDNIAQASVDAKEGRPTASSGGHEHVSAKFTPYPNGTAKGSEIIGKFSCHII